MVAAGLLARKAVERGLESKPWVKTSLAPGSRVVTDYLERAGPRWSRSTRCASTSSATAARPASATPARCPTRSPHAVSEHDLAVVSVLSGNRNFEGRIHPQVRASYLASPPLVVAYALAGTHRRSTSTREPLGTGSRRRARLPARHLADAEEVRDADRLRDRRRRCTRRSTRRVWEGDERWREHGRADRRPVRVGPRLDLRPRAAVLRGPAARARRRRPTSSARACWRMLGDSVTTDHISPAGSIPPDSPAGRYLIEHGVEPRDFNSYGSRRGNHEVMIRGTFANIRLRNGLVPGVEGGVTLHLPDGEQLSIYDAAERLPRRGRAAGRVRRQGVRLRLVPRLGRQGHAAAGRARRDRRVVRAHPPLQPGRHGRAAAAVPRRRVARVARPHRPRARSRSAASPTSQPRQTVHGRGGGRRRHHPHLRGAGPHRRAGRASTTCATAASCRWCCGG